MKNYKLSVSKNGKKYNIIFKAENEILARERVHKEWYSILSIEEITEKQELWNTFIFSAYTKDWEFKKWKIVWNDIFKTYIKLKKDLDYKVKLLYSENENDLSDIKKEQIVKDLEEQYNLIFSWKNNKKDKWDEIKEKLEKEKNENKNLDNFYLKKELEQTYKLIDFVLNKLNNLINNNEEEDIDISEKEKLKNIYNSIIKLKTSTNITKLKEVWEFALIKIWEIELRELENNKSEISKKLLKETNFLLKKVGSKKTFIEKDKDIWYILKTFFSNIKIFDKEEKKEKIDEFSHNYAKNKLLLKKYKEKLKENNKFIFKNIIKVIFNKNFKEEVFLKNKILKQNIYLFKTKIKGLNFSYTFVKKWFNTIILYIIDLINNLSKYLFIIIILYLIIFNIFLNINYYFNWFTINYGWFFYFLIIFLLYIIFYLTRNFFLIIFNFVILFFIIIFWVVNF